MPTVATTADASRGEIGHGWPAFLPDGRHFLLVAMQEKGSLSLKVGSLDSTETKLVDKIDSRAEYSTTGHVLYASQGTLLARPSPRRSWPSPESRFRSRKRSRPRPIWRTFQLQRPELSPTCRVRGW